MQNADTSNRLHPLVAGAAVSVMLVSLIGVAAITGILPNSNGTISSAQSTPAVLLSKAPVPQSFIAEPTEVKVNSPVESIAQEPQQPKMMRKPVIVQAQQSLPEPRPDYAQRRPVAQTAQARQVCHSCGQIVSVDAVRQQVQPSGVGIAAGAVLGGLLGNQVGGGNGRKVATVAGAVGGGFAGNEVERRTRQSTSYHVRVRMEDGSIRSFPQSGGTNGWQAGDRVRVVDGALRSRG